MTAAGHLVEALSRPDAYPHPTGPISVCETHISWVFLTGDYAYKVKKPVRLEFLDFSTLAARHHFCQEELRLNRRTAPAVYLDVVPITGSPSAPAVCGRGAPFEYAVRMRQFGPDAELERRLASGTLDSASLRAFGERMARFHEDAERTKSGHFGQPGQVCRRIDANLDQIGPRLEPDERARLEPVARWLRTTAQALTARIGARATNGWVRECHGDLHLGNLVALEDGIAAFDCIEFDPALRWIDVIDDISFLVMDLLTHERADLAFAFLDSYLAATGDYPGLQLLDLYIVNRSIVRAKVAAVTRGTERPDARADATAAIRRHLAFGAQWPRRPSPVLVLMHGLPASGKSSIALALAEALPAIRLSSDIERKRQAGLARRARSDSPPGGGLYDRRHNQATYARLLSLAETVLRSGQNVIVDATFLKFEARARFCALGSRLDHPVVLVDCRAPLEVLDRRIEARAASPQDSEADRNVLRYALDQQEPLRADEAVLVLQTDTSGPLDRASLAARLRTLAESGSTGPRQ